MRSPSCSNVVMDQARGRINVVLVVVGSCKESLVNLKLEKKKCTYGPNDASGVVWARFCRSVVVR